MLNHKYNYTNILCDESKYLYYLMVITIQPTIANNNIIDVSISHIKYELYIMLPILVIWVASAMLLSQELELV